jgi:ATP-binding cassette subfamily F protein 3
MHLIRLDGISVQHGGRVLFRDVDWAIGEGDRVGLVGPNGAGKSSLLRAIAGTGPVEAGRVTRRRGVTVGYLPQEPEIRPERTLFEEASAPPAPLREVEAELSSIEAQLADPGVTADARRLQRALDRQQEALARYEALGGPRHASRARELLAHLGFRPEQFDLEAAVLSGGQKKLVALVRVALASPDVLLLDEPDNHLDLEAKRKLESFVHAWPGAVIVVSHDRYLLDETTGRTAELEGGRLELYEGGYSAYSAERELRRLRQLRRYADQQKEIARIEASIARFELWASMVVNERHIKQARSRRKMLDRMEARGELVERVVDRRPMKLRLEGGRGSTRALSLEGVAMAFDGSPLFSDLDLLMTEGERVGLIGPNGAGKSVLFRLILGELEPRGGRIRVGPSTRIGYYAQEHQTLERWLDSTALRLVRDAAPLTEGSAVSFLMRFQLGYEQVRQPIRTLSGGERSRLQLALLMLERPNLLLLDEPTNNLDIASAEVLESALEQFEGSLLLISHDRYLLDRAVDRVLVLEAGTLRAYPGGYTDYLEAVATGGQPNRPRSPERQT